MRTSRLLITGAALSLALMVPIEAWAVELSGGVGLGGFLAGTVPRFAVSPHAGLSWRVKRDFFLAVQDLASILPPNSTIAIGVYNQTSVAIGYVSEKASFSAGPSLSIYNMAACGPSLCGRVGGLGVGAHAQTDVYITGSLGISVSANMDWIGGRSLVLPGGVAVMVVAGPVVRWGNK